MRTIPGKMGRSGAGSVQHWLAVVGGSFGLSLAPISACSTLPGTRSVSIATLERAAMVEAAPIERRLIADVDALGPLATVLSSRVRIFELRSDRDWRCFERAADPNASAPERPFAAPDFSRGMVVGVISRLGEPIDGGWPIRVESIRTVDGAGLLSARLETGNYLPNAAAYAEMVFVEGLSAVLAVDINGDRFYPADIP